MSETLLGLFADYGIYALFAILLTASVGVPFPSSLLLLAAGSLAQQGEIDPALAFAAGVLGAVIGDQIGYAIGRYAGRRAVSRLANRIGVGGKVEAAEVFARRWSGPGIFFTRWLVGALGPWINITSGMSDYPWRRFILWDVAGELLWVLLYGGLGYAFSDRVQAISELIGNLSWTIAGLGVTIFLGYHVYRSRYPAVDTDAAPVVTTAT